MTTHQQVQNYYGAKLGGSEDLQTNACWSDASVPPYLKAVLGNIDEEVLSRYYGCGLVAPQQLAGMRILDLGSGSGRDAYALAALAGEQGYVVGVDMTDEQLAVARRHIKYHRERFGFREPNVEFRKGFIERLDELGFADQSFDIIVSNCVINLSPDKEAVLRQAYRLLKPGGEMYFSDVYSDRRVPAALQADPVLYGECLGGALYWNDFLNIARNAGFPDPRLVEDRRLTIDNPELEARIGAIRFYSATYRLFRIPGLEPSCENFGQAVRYRGTVAHQPYEFVLDSHHRIRTGEEFPVCGNTYRMLNESRFQEHFEFSGGWEHHYGIFDGCGTSIPFGDEKIPAGGACC